MPKSVLRLSKMGAEYLGIYAQNWHMHPLPKYIWHDYVVQIFCAMLLWKTQYIRTNATVDIPKKGEFEKDYDAILHTLFLSVLPWGIEIELSHKKKPHAHAAMWKIYRDYAKGNIKGLILAYMDEKEVTNIRRILASGVVKEYTRNTYTGKLEYTGRAARLPKGFYENLVVVKLPKPFTTQNILRFWMGMENNNKSSKKITISDADIALASGEISQEPP
jgi:hypothetical protein